MRRYGREGGQYKSKEKKKRRRKEVVSPSVRKEHSLLCVAEKRGKSVS